MGELHSHCQCDQCSGDDCRDLPVAKTVVAATDEELVNELLKRGKLSWITTQQNNKYLVVVK